MVNLLKEAGSVDPDYVIFKHGGIDKIELVDGKIKDAENILKTSKEQYPAMFKQDQPETPPEDPSKRTYQKVMEKKLNPGTGNTDQAVNTLTDALSDFYK